MSEFPARSIHAVIDVGSKSTRLLVARRLSETAFEVVDEERFDSRLGEGQDGGKLTDAAFDRGVRAMRVLTQLASAYGPDRIVAVGTEAIRRAENGTEFIARVQAETGVHIRTLPAREEAFASFLGVVNSSNLQTACLVDIGGGSLEVMRVEQRRLLDADSLPLGAIYATEQFLRSDPPISSEIDALRQAVRDGLGNEYTSPVLYAAGGAIRNLARMARLRRNYPLRRLHGFVMQRHELEGLIRELCDVDQAGRRKLPGMNLDRVATLPAAAVVIDEVMEVVRASEVYISGQGMREGLLWQELRGQNAVLPDVRAASVAGLAAANGVDIVSAEPAMNVAARLFQVTRSVHGFGSEELDLLLYAARLAEIGQHIDYYNRDRHAEYLVHSGDLHGFRHREIVLLAAIVRWSMSGSADLKPYASIVEEGDEQRVRVLAGLLGFARAIWRRKPSPVFDVDASISDGGLEIALSGGGPIDAELYVVEKPARRLESALKIPVTVVERA